MAKFYGKIGYAIGVEKRPGVWVDEIEEKSYPGFILKDVRQWRMSEDVNDDLNISNRISIIGDRFAYDNIGNIKYVVWFGSKWKVTSVEVSHPRLILSIGGLYIES